MDPFESSVRALLLFVCKQAFRLITLFRQWHEWFDEVGAELPLKNTDTVIIDEISEKYRDI